MGERLPGGGSRRWLVAVAGVLALAGCGSDAPTGPSPDPLRLQCPALLEIPSKDGVGAQLAFAPVVEGGRAPVTTVCSPASGAILPIGNTNVSCTASDTAGQSAGCAFTVRVTAPPRLKYTRFLAFGDSITEGKVGLSPSLLVQVAFPGAYPERLQVLLAERYTAQTIDVLNRGVGGERLEQGRGRLPDVLETDRPEVLLLLEGVNNIKNEPLSELVTDLRAMLGSARRRNIEVLLALVLPIGAAREAREPGILAAIRAFNEEIERIARESGLGEPVDLYTPFVAEPSLLGADGLHPTEAGYVRMAELFYDAIRTRWELPPDTPEAAPSQPVEAGR